MAASPSVPFSHMYAENDHSVSYMFIPATTCSILYMLLPIILMLPQLLLCMLSATCDVSAKRCLAITLSP